MSLQYSETMSVDTLAPMFSLPGADGQTYSLESFRDKKGLLVVITCNHCPYAKASWPLITDLHKQFGHEVAFVAINPNDATAYPDDSFEVMKQKVGEWQIPFPYLRDESQEVARAYRAQCTPDLYLFHKDKGEFRLFYHGRVNDNWQEPEKVTQENLKNALQALVGGNEPPSIQPPSMGCSIKWKEL